MIWTTFLAGLPTWLTVVAVLISIPEPSTAVDFGGTCNHTTLCDATKDLECAVLSDQTKQCKCKENTYYNGGTCANNNIANLQVINPGESTVSQTQLSVTWTLPTHSSSIDRIEISTSPVTQTVTVNNPLTTQATLTGLTAGTTYTITITSIDTTSRATEQSTSVTTTGTTGTKVGFDAVCDGSSLVCDTIKDLDCVNTATQKQCKCKTVNTYYYGDTCVGHPIENLRVTNPAVTTVSQTQLSVTWNLPTHSSSIDSIHVSTTARTLAVTINKPLHTNQVALTGLTAGTPYIITITSIDTTSRATAQSTSVITSETTERLKMFDETCSNALKCDVSKNLECTQQLTCKCKQNHYYLGGTCLATLSALKSTNFQVTVSGTDSVSMTWTNPSANVSSVIERRQVRWTGTATGSKDVSLSDSSTTVTGLTPGGPYNFNVVSLDDNSGTSPLEVLSDTAPITTRPAVPGKIKTISPDITGNQVALTWIASAGIVTNYRVVFDGGNGDTHTQTTLNNIGSITMTLLTPGRRYNITITAVSGTMTSDPRYGNTRTTVIAPGAPTHLQCITIMDTNVTLSWTPPVNPNGDIMYYSVNVISRPGSPRTVNTTTPTPTKEIDQLTEDNLYSFTVSARNDKYTGPQSFTVTCKTKPGLPSKPQNLLITAVLSRDFNVSWMKPNSTKGQLIGYRIAVNNRTTCSKEILYQCSNCVQKPSFTSSCPMDAKITFPIIDTGLQNDSFIRNLVGLYPYTTYSVSVNAITGAGDGYKETAMVETKQEAPQVVTYVLADVLNSTAIKLTWSIPGPRPGVTTYTIDLYDYINGKQTLNKTVEVSGFYERSTILTNLEEYWQYVFNIKASTIIGTSAVKTILPYKTLPAAPGKVAKFKVSKPDGDYKTAIVTWRIPSLRDRNSLITSYEFIHNATGTLESKILSQSTNNEDPFTESITVQPENYYYIEVFAISHENRSGVSSSELYYAPPGPPPNFETLPGIKVIKRDIETPETETTVTVLYYLNQFTANENGKILNNGMILCHANALVSTQRQYRDYELFTTWKMAKRDRLECYRTTNTSWLILSSSTVRKRSAHEYVSYTIGDDSTCDQKPEKNYCNGPLNPGTSYNVYIFVCTNGGCTESQPIVITTKEKETTTLFTGAIAGSTVTVAIIITVVIVIVIIIRRRKNNSKSGKDESYDDLQMTPYVNQGRVTSEDKTYTSLYKQNKINRYRSLNVFNLYQIVMEMHKDSNLKFAEEFQDLEILSAKDQVQTAKLQSNRRKNRDENILPFDRSRVKFTEEKNNYINASYLQNFKNKSTQDFIVTQHPLSNTKEDFWTMIWEQNVSVIVMLTPNKDDCQVGYDTYFPSEPQSSKQYGFMTVETMTKWRMQMAVFSTIKLKKGKKSRIIKHFQSLGWNDVYDRTMQTEIVQFIEAVKSNVTSSDKLGPTVVHCGLGTGRSGVYIALYQLMDCIHDNNVDIFDLVLTMRESRMKLVEYENQYRESMKGYRKEGDMLYFKHT